jgi:hypothetical protein
LESRILREEKKMWKRWKAWTLPSKIGVLSGIVTIALIPTVFVDVKPFVTHWLWPAKPHHIPNIAVQSKRPEFPSGMTSGIGLTISLWFMKRKRELNVAFAGGGRLRRSEGLRS